MRTKTKATKITAIFLVLTMLMSISTGIMASEPESNNTSSCSLLPNENQVSVDGVTYTFG